MEDWAREFLDLWQANRVRIAETLCTAAEKNPYVPVKGYSVGDFVQMVDGFVAMIREELDSGGGDVRDMYMSAVVPGLIAQGQPLSVLVGQLTMNAIIVHGLLVPQASDKNREQISTFLANWYMKFNLDMVKVGLECGAAS